MCSVLDELLTFNFSSSIEKDVQKLRKRIDEQFFNLRKFKDSADFVHLEKERHRQGDVETIVDNSTKKKKQNEATPLADITQNVIQLENITVKKEKISTAASLDSISTISDVSTRDVGIEIKKEAEDMPAPRKLPPRKKKIKTENVDIPKRPARTRTKPRKYDEFVRDSDRGKPSDVMIQNTTITTIDITEDNMSDIESKKNNVDKNVPEKEEPVNETVRSTRSKMRQNKKQMPTQDVTDSQTSESAEPEVKKIKSTRTKTIKNNKRNRSNSSDQEKVREQSRGITTANATYIASVDAPLPILNQTVVLENHKTVQKDDGNEPEVKSKQPKEKVPFTPPKPKSKKKTKEIFSPFEKTPLKKKVEAFEKLQSDASNIPVKIKSKISSADERENNRVSGKPKAFTPFSSKFLPKTCSTSKINKVHPGKLLDVTTNHSDSILSAKSLSALKASQAEFKEREKRRQEKESEALKKREALLLAQTEEKRRRREEKQLKAQQQREILEKEKQKLLEEHKRKEEKYKQAIAEKEEKLQKQREEAERKRLLAKKKADIIKEKEEKMKEEERVAEQKETELAKQIQKQKMQKLQLGSLPVYMTTRAPLLPTEDCYDSDDCDYQKKNERVPDWGRGKELDKKLRTMIVAGEKMKNTLFCVQTYTPDLQEIFVYIDPRKLKRTSSAIWRKPPRYTLFTASNNVHFSEDSEDEIDV
ncbi:uncharacterized protein [Leptinotarsa decemlineata]|uniref:uncharacterized protein n=1 Tax=Leptinotarsa decemlineata TaxID=7539 RepID=UPI003D30B25F